MFHNIYNCNNCYPYFQRGGALLKLGDLSDEALGILGELKNADDLDNIIKAGKISDKAISIGTLLELSKNLDDIKASLKNSGDIRGIISDIIIVKQTNLETLKNIPAAPIKDAKEGLAAAETLLKSNPGSSQAAKELVANVKGIEATLPRLNKAPPTEITGATKLDDVPPGLETKAATKEEMVKLATKMNEVKANNAALYKAILPYGAAILAVGSFTIYLAVTGKSVGDVAKELGQTVGEVAGSVAKEMGTGVGAGLGGALEGAGEASGIFAFFREWYWIFIIIFILIVLSVVIGIILKFKS